MDVAVVDRVFASDETASHLECPVSEQLNEDTEDSNEDVDKLCSSFLDLVYHFDERRSKSDPEF
jgi:hypothetical protein